MRTPSRSNTFTVATALLATALATASCSANSPQSASATSTAASSTAASPSFPYPPIQLTWEIASPMNEQDAEVARFALEVEALERTWFAAHEDESLLPEINVRVGHANKPLSLDHRALPETGGKLFRAVGVGYESDSQWTVTICEYDTPGIYKTGNDGELTLSSPNNSYRAVHSTVASTTEKSGSGERSATPRLLVMDNSDVDYNETARRTCEQFRPDPYIQQPPQPIPPGK